MNTSVRWLVFGFVAMNFGILAGNVFAKQLPDAVNRPSGADVDPVEKVMCRF